MFFLSCSDFNTNLCIMLIWVYFVGTLHNYQFNSKHYYRVLFNLTFLEPFSWWNITEYLCKLHCILCCPNFNFLLFTKRQRPQKVKTDLRLINEMVPSSYKIFYVQNTVWLFIICYFLYIGSNWRLLWDLYIWSIWYCVFKFICINTHQNSMTKWHVPHNDNLEPIVLL